MPTKVLNLTSRIQRIKKSISITSLTSVYSFARLAPDLCHDAVISNTHPHNLIYKLVRPLIEKIDAGPTS